MRKNQVRLLFLCLSILSIGILSACGSDGKSEPSDSSANPSETRMYKDFTRREVTIPAHPKKIILLGNNAGDLLALGVKPIGNDWLGEPYVYKSELTGIADIGYPHNMEKIIELEPDLILQDGYGNAEDSVTYEALSKIAPTAVYNRDAPTYERIRELADIIGNKQAAEEWITRYETKAQATWEKIGLKPGETATVYLSLAGDFYVMGHFSMTMSLYQPKGFSPSAKVQQLIDQNEPFAPISAEVLHEFAGDHVFLLSSPGSEDEKEAKKLIEGPLWQALPAVKNNQAYTADIVWNASDPITMERFMDELPKIMGK